MATKHTILDPIDKLFGDVLTLSNKATLIITDTHCPYQNKELLVSAFEIAKSRNIKRLVHAGDLIDAAAYNTQSKHEIVPPIELEIEHARSILYTATNYFTEIVIMPGNHDAHFFKKEKLTFKEFIHAVILNNLYTNKVTVTDYDYVYYTDLAIIGHLSSGYDMVGGKIAAQLALKYNRHSLVGHDHLSGMVLAENGKMGISIGAMFMPGMFAYKTKSYNLFPNSQLGFVIIQNSKIHHFDGLLHEKVYG